jgi:SNF2 family DNA or RNA helicase
MQSVKKTAPPLFNHQRVSIDFLKDRARTYDASDPGTGKTRVAIEAFAARRLNNAGCALVLAPKSLLRAAWQDDFEKFAPLLTTSVATATNREKAFAENADVYITNTDAVNWLAKQKPAFFKRFKDGMLVVDEAQAYKHHTSQRSKSLKKIKKHFKYIHLMSGTPSSNLITDLWAQYQVLDDGARLGSSFFSFRANVCAPKQVGPLATMVKWTEIDGIQTVVSKLVEDITIRHKFEDCISIPENHLETINYYLSAKQLKAYQDMTEHAIAQMPSGELINAVNGAAVATKLMQISSGAVYNTQGEYSLIDTGRYELVADLIEARAHCVVFFQWKHQKDELIKVFEARGITFAVIDGESTDKERAQGTEYFQKGFYRVLLAHPKSAAHGLTLTRGTSTIWVSPTHNLEWWLQGNRRIYRAGQTQRTETIVVTAPGTREEGVAEILQVKDVRQSDLLALLTVSKLAAATAVAPVPEEALP